MAGRMQRNFHAVPVDGFAIIHALHGRIAQSPQQNGNAIVLAEIGFAAPTRMVGMPVRDDRAPHWPPGIDVKISRRTVEAFGTRNDQIHRGIWRGLSGSVRVICTNAAKTSLPRRLEVSIWPSANNGRSRASCVFFAGSWGTPPGLIHGLMTARIPWSQRKMQGISPIQPPFAKIRLENISEFRCLRMNSPTRTEQGIFLPAQGINSPSRE